MNGFGIIFIIVLIILGVAIYQNGFDGLKEEPVQSSLDSTKTIYEAGKKAVNAGKDIYDNTKSGSSSETVTLTKIGQPFCTNDADCLTLEECSDSTCVCGEGGYCYK